MGAIEKGGRKTEYNQSQSKDGANQSSGPATASTPAAASASGNASFSSRADDSAMAGSMARVPSGSGQYSSGSAALPSRDAGSDEEPTNEFFSPDEYFGSDSDNHLADGRSGNGDRDAYEGGARGDANAGFERDWSSRSRGGESTQAGGGSGFVGDRDLDLVGSSFEGGGSESAPWSGGSPAIGSGGREVAGVVGTGAGRDGASGSNEGLAASDAAAFERRGDRRRDRHQQFRDEWGVGGSEGRGDPGRR